MLSTSMYYAIRSLCESGITKLPISYEDVIHLLRADGWDIIIYDSSHDKNTGALHTLGIWDAVKSRKGFAIKKGSKKVVFLSAELSAYERIIVLVHELAHIKLEHFSDTGILGYHADNDNLNNLQETEANDFILAFLAPTCVLKKCGITDCDAIITYTALDRQRAERIAGVIHDTPRNMTPDEQTLCEQFHSFIIHQNKTRRIARYAFICAILACFLVAITLLYNTVFPNTFSTPRFIEDFPHSATPTVSTVPSPTVSISEEQVIITPSGKKYHTPNCPSIKYSEPVYIDKNKALQMGYGACLRCKP